MVLENLTDFESSKNHWGRVFAFGFFVNTVSLVVASIIFEPAAGLVALFLVSAAAFPLMSKIFEAEETIDVSGGGHFLERHGKMLKIYSGFFMGVLLSTSISYFSMDQAHANDVFSFQLSALKSSHIGDRTTGAAFDASTFNVILVNNLRVAFISFAVSMLFGAAAVFIVTWNASVIAVFAGILAKASAMPLAGYGVVASPLAFLFGLFSATGSIALHGIPEIMSYFVAGLAGGIISTGIEKEKLNSERFRKVAKDGVILFTIAILMIFVAAAIESY
ncbi:MAG: stage II sporulation protein M [Candidatus Aenigmarchaeota archaeon]|nr:stage II sporulation protein M [Candidatus Aenigmarchaeota archaeon]